VFEGGICMLERNRILIHTEEQPHLKIEIFYLACMMNISGWIVNIDKGILEIIAQADEKELSNFKLTIRALLEEGKRMETILCDAKAMNRNNFLIG